VIGRNPRASQSNGIAASFSIALSTTFSNVFCRVQFRFNIMKWKEETTPKHQGKLIEIIVLACAHERHALRVLAAVGKFKNGTASSFCKSFFAKHRQIDNPLNNRGQQ
jgi:hypothetical protein